MNKEDKQLILVDLCARLPYNVKCERITYADYNDIKDNYESEKVTGILSEIHYYKFECIYVVIGLMDECPLETVKPYLRPMSSMTKDEREEYLAECYKDAESTLSTPHHHGSDWLNAHHFDYRGLIGKGLAISTEEYNPYKP